jgi:ATP-dependent DNA helicase RecG
MPASQTDRKFMEMAVEEMRKSRSEHTNNRDPMVGAVLVGKDGKLLGATHRADLRVGDHAEFTLIERYLRDKNLEGSTLYVTLEPCTRRNKGKTPCAEHVVNARIGRAFIGMTDPNPDICGRGVQYLLNHGVEVVFFDLDLVRQIWGENQSFIDYYEALEGGTGSATEQFEGASRYELEVVERASLGDFSHDAIQTYLAKREIEVSVPSNALWKLMGRAGYIARNSKGKLSPTVAGVTLFATDPAEILPQCRVSFEARKAGRSVSDDFEGPLILFRDYLDKFFQDQMRYFTEIREFDRINVGEYPAEALRESAFNAVIHRDYHAGARVHIVLKEGEVEIKSPGGLLKPLSLPRVRTFNAPPYSRNPHIAVTIHRMGWIEEKGSGLGRMRDTMMAHGLRPPAFDFKDGYFVVTLPGQGQAWSNVRVSPGTLAALEEPQRRIIEFVLANGRIATKDAAEKLRVNVATARRYLGGLVQKGVLESRGGGPRLSYHLAGSE